MDVKIIKFVNELQKYNPNLNIKIKEDSILMKILTIILFFNKKFMTNFITTIGSTVYFPKDCLINVNKSIVILAHEFVHSMDSRKNILFKFLYLLPISLLPFTFMFLLISWKLFLIVFLFCFLPLPAPFRMYYELRGYSMTLFAWNELFLEWGWSKEDRINKLVEFAEGINKNFTGPNYYFMWIFGIKNELNKIINDVINDDIIKDDVNYMYVRNAFKQSLI